MAKQLPGLPAPRPWGAVHCAQVLLGRVVRPPPPPPRVRARRNGGLRFPSLLGWSLGPLAPSEHDGAGRGRWDIKVPSPRTNWRDGSLQADPRGPHGRARGAGLHPGTCPCPTAPSALPVASACAEARQWGLGGSPRPPPRPSCTLGLPLHPLGSSCILHPGSSCEPRSPWLPGAPLGSPCPPQTPQNPLNPLFPLNPLHSGAAPHPQLSPAPHWALAPPSGEGTVQPQAPEGDGARLRAGGCWHRPPAPAPAPIPARVHLPTSAPQLV